MFAPHDTVTATRVCTKPEIGLSWGFGFVDMETSNDATHAIESLNGVALDGHTLTDRKARV